MRTDDRETLECLIAGVCDVHPPEHRYALRVANTRLDLGTNDSGIEARLRRYLDAWDVSGAVDAEHADELTFDVIQAPPVTLSPELEAQMEHWPRPPGKRRKEAWVDVAGGRVVRKVRTDMLFMVGPTGGLAVGDCHSNLNQVINFIDHVFMSHRIDDGWVLCHAAGLAASTAAPATGGPEPFAGQGIGIAADSGAGKSTLMLHLLTAFDGLRFVSNDRLLVHSGDAHPRMCGVPKWPRINPGTALHNARLRTMLPPDRRSQLEALPRERLWELEDKMTVDVPERYGERRTQLCARLDAFIMLTWSRDQEGASPPRLVSVPSLDARPDLTRLVAKSPGPFHAPCDVERAHAARDNPDPESWDAVFDGVECWALEGGVDFGRAVELIGETLTDRGWELRAT